MKDEYSILGRVPVPVRTGTDTYRYRYVPVLIRTGTGAYRYRYVPDTSTHTVVEFNKFGNIASYAIYNSILYLSKASPITLIYHNFKNLFSITKRRTEIWFSIIVMNIGMAK
jgi:hypothetical protein